MHAVCQTAVLPGCDLMPTTCLTAGQSAECHSQTAVATAEEGTAEVQQHNAVQKHTGGQAPSQQQDRDCADHNEVPGSVTLLLRPAAAPRRAVEQEATLHSAAVCLGTAQATVKHSQHTGSGSGSDGGVLAGHGGLCRDAAGSSEAVAAWLKDAASCGVEMRSSLGRRVCCPCLRPASAGGTA